jgi:UDPglucose 6-dehydrogenase
VKIGFIGLGKLGLPVALAIESKGYKVKGYDINPAVKNYVVARTIPFEEKDLQPLLDKTEIDVVDSIAEVVKWADIIFLPIQTPHNADYEGVTRLPSERIDFDYSYLIEAIKTIVNESDGRELILAVISTCLPGTYDRDIKPLIPDNIHYVYTPQFIAMGTVLEDYLHPEFNLIGVEDDTAADQIEALYKTINDAPSIRTDITTAEGIKVSYNTWITAKTVIANTWGEIAYKMGMNFDDIYKAWTLSNKRLVSTRYMNSGVGDGGGCHPRDNIAMSWLASSIGMEFDLFEALMLSREAHMEFIADEAILLSERQNLPIILLGKSFKPETNIETGSPSRLLANLLEEKGANFTHFEDIIPEIPAIYVIGTQHKRYNDYRFPSKSVVLDPFRYIDEQEGISIIHIGKNNE